MELKRHRRVRDEHNPPITIGSLPSVARSEQDSGYVGYMLMTT